MPASLSAIIMHLLEKEPDHRYQTADGLVYDLERLRDAGHVRRRLRCGSASVMSRCGCCRRRGWSAATTEVAALEAAFEEALAGRCRGVLVSGAPGVGKTALVDELRPVVTGRDGWFVAGKFDQYRRDLEFDGVYQAFRALGRLLLAEPEDELAAVRERILRALGANAGLLTAVVPEFAALLAVPPDPGDPLTAQVRAQRSGVAVLRAVASRKRPVVMFVDDLQWAGRTPLGFVDLVLSEEPVDGLLLVGAYRDGDVDAAHPLAAPLSRWRDQAGVRHLRLDNLPAAEPRQPWSPRCCTWTAAAAADLAEVIASAHLGQPVRDGGAAQRAAPRRPADRDGRRVAVGRPRPCARTWASPTSAGLPAARVEALPPQSRAAGGGDGVPGRAGRAEPAADRDRRSRPSVVEQALAPALDDGLLVAEPGAQQAVRFRHDRIREAILAGLDPPRRRALQLAHGAAAGRGAGAVRGRGRAVPAGGRRGRRRRRAPSGGGAAAARRRPGGVDRRLRAGERAAGRRAAADRPGRDRHADRGAHRPARRAVQPGAPGRGRRGVPHHREAVPHRAWTARTRRRCRCAA